jgi:catechol 2,3-dioxygenase-like lactoylglutathione lyase family enzyme
MSSEQSSQPTFLTVAPRFIVHDLEQALAFYEQLGFEPTYHDEHFAVLERDGVDLHLNHLSDAPSGSRSVCWISSPIARRCTSSIC